MEGLLTYVHIQDDTHFTYKETWPLCVLTVEVRTWNRMDAFPFTLHRGIKTAALRVGVVLVVRSSS